MPNKLIAHVTRALVCSAFLFSASSAFAQTDSKKEIRVVSAAGSLTEVIYLLNEQDKLVGVDTTSIYPEAATKLPQVGYQRALSSEGILSLNPTVLLATEEAGPPPVIQQLQATDLPVTIIPVEYTTEGVAKKIRAVASAVNQTEAGEALVKTLEAEMDSLEKEIQAEVKTPKRAIFIMHMGGGSPMVAGLHTAANAMINLAGGFNPMTSYQGYKPINIESLIDINPEVIILTKRTLEGLGGLEGIKNVAGLNMTDAVKNDHITILDDMSALGFTPRLADAAKTIYTSIYPPKAQ
ncbi:hemin ABC transporter substrate-binding protein [Leucothrix sargassi]|nr:hemin ABC transporter substrate-binding protein [Leucothrix sargassi]